MHTHNIISWRFGIPPITVQLLLDDIYVFGLIFNIGPCVSKSPKTLKQIRLTLSPVDRPEAI